MDLTTDHGCRFRPNVAWGVLLAGLSVVDSLSLPARAQDMPPVLVRVEDHTRVSNRDRVVVRDPQTGADRVVYRSDGHIPYDLALSPDGRYVSFIEVVGAADVKKRRLVVVQLSDNTVRLFGETPIHGVRGIREHIWCCGPGQLAIMTGTVGEPQPIDEAASLPLGVSVIDVGTGSYDWIEGVSQPLQMSWAPFDSSLYIKAAPPPEARGKPGGTRPIYRYHVPTERLSLTSHLGVFFSPDGEYYFDTGVHEASGSFFMYRTADDQDVTKRLAVPSHYLGPDGGWMPGADHLFVFIEKPAPEPPKPREKGEKLKRVDSGTPRVYPELWNVAVDAETGRITERFQGDIRAGWRTNAAALPVVRSAGAVELINRAGDAIKLFHPK